MRPVSSFIVFPRVNYTVVLLILMAVGLSLRLYNLEVTGLWMDEIHSAIGSDPGKTMDQVIEYCKTDQPPVFFLILHGWYKISSYNDFSGRLLVAITGVLGILVMYIVGKEFRNQQAGIVAAFLTTINYMHIDFSRQIRFYPLLFLLSALSYLFFLRIFKTRQFRDFLLYTVSTAALLNTHYFGLVVFLSQFLLLIILLLYKKIHDARFIVSCLISGMIAGLSIVHWIPVITSDLGVTQFHIQPVPWYFPFTYYLVYFRDVITCFVCAVLLLFAFRDIFRDKHVNDISIENIILLGWIFFGFLIPLLYSWLRIPMLEYKYSIIVVPSLFVLIGTGFTIIQHKTTRLLCVVVLFVSFMINAWYVKPIYFRKPFEEWREITQEISKTDNPKQNVFSRYAWYYRYYFKVFGLHDQPYEPQYADFTKILDNSNMIWVVQETRYSDGGLSIAQQQLLNEFFSPAKELEFVDARATFFVRKN